MFLSLKDCSPHTARMNRDSTKVLFRLCFSDVTIQEQLIGEVAAKRTTEVLVCTRCMHHVNRVWAYGRLEL